MDTGLQGLPLMATFGHKTNHLRHLFGNDVKGTVTEQYYNNKK